MPRQGYDFTNGFHEPIVHAAVVSAVRTAFVRSRTSPRAWAHRLDEGRLDPRNVWRAGATGKRDIFRDRLAPGATKVNVHILVDGSGSMAGTDQLADDGVTQVSRIIKAMDITATLVDAFRGQPQVRLNVWMHNTVSQYGEIAMWPIVTNGQGRQNVGLMRSAVGGGNGDGYAIKWVGDKVHRSHRKGEVDLLIMVSDGLPSWLSQGRDPGVYDYTTGTYKGDGNNGVKLVFNAVQELRDRGTRTLAIAIAPNANQAEMYGEDNVIPFDGDWSQLAVDIGAALGKVLADAAKDPRTAKR